MWTWQSLERTATKDEVIGALNMRLKALSGLLASLERDLHGVGSFTDADTTPQVTGAHLWQTANTGATSITAFDGGRRGQRIRVLFGDGNTTLVHSATLVLVGATNKTGSAGELMTFITEDGATWREVPNR